MGVLRVFYADYPNARIILRRGWIVVDMAAEPGGKVLLMDD